jgi:multisubunit Na+/H+ antiporter MnhB subunit
MRTAYAISTRLLSILLVLLGVALVVSTLARGGGALAVGVVFGVALVALGAGRLWLARAGGAG